MNAEEMAIWEARWLRATAGDYTTQGEWTRYFDADSGMPFYWKDAAATKAGFLATFSTPAAWVEAAEGPGSEVWGVERNTPQGSFVAGSWKSSRSLESKASAGSGSLASLPSGYTLPAGSPVAGGAGGSDSSSSAGPRRTGSYDDEAAAWDQSAWEKDRGGEYGGVGAKLWGRVKVAVADARGGVEGSVFSRGKGRRRVNEGHSEDQHVGSVMKKAMSFKLPSLEQGEIYRNLHRLVDEDEQGIRKPYGICSSSVSDFEKHGIGLALYFRMVHGLGMIMLIMFLIHMPVIAINVAVALEANPGMHMVLATTMGGWPVSNRTDPICPNITAGAKAQNGLEGILNAAISGEANGTAFVFETLRLGGGFEVERYFVSAIFAGLDVLAQLVFLLGIGMMQVQFAHLAGQKRAKNPFPSYYAVEVLGLPKTLPWTDKVNEQSDEILKTHLKTVLRTMRNRENKARGKALLQLGDSTKGWSREAADAAKVLEGLEAADDARAKEGLAPLPPEDPNNNYDDIREVEIGINMNGLLSLQRKRFKAIKKLQEIRGRLEFLRRRAEDQRSKDRKLNYTPPPPLSSRVVPLPAGGGGGEPPGSMERGTNRKNGRTRSSIVYATGMLSVQEYSIYKKREVSLEAEIIRLSDSIEKKRIHKKGTKDGRTGDEAVCAFVVFNNEQALVDLKNVYARVCECCTCCQPKRLRLLNKYPITLVHAPEPSDIVWESLELSACNRRIRLCLIITVCMLLLIVSFAFVSLCTVTQSKSLQMQKDLDLFCFKPLSDTALAVGEIRACSSDPAGCMNRTDTMGGCGVDVKGAKLTERDSVKCPACSGGTVYNNITHPTWNKITKEQVAGCTSDSAKVSAVEDWSSDQRYGGSIDKYKTCVDDRKIRCPGNSTGAAFAAPGGMCTETDWQLNFLRCRCTQVGPVIMLQNYDACGPVLVDVLSGQGVYFAVAMVVVLANLALKEVIRHGLVPCAKMPSVSREELLSTSLVFYTTFINTALIQLVVHGDSNVIFVQQFFAFFKALKINMFGLADAQHCELGSAWFDDVGVGLILTLSINFFVALKDVCLWWPLEATIRTWYRCRLRAGHFVRGHQREFNKLLLGSEFEPWDRLPLAMNTVFVALFYGSGMPILYGVAFLVLFALYWADKIALIRHFRAPPQYDERVTLAQLHIMPWAVVLHGFIACWIFGNESLTHSCVLPEAWTLIYFQIGDVIGGSAHDGFLVILEHVLRAAALPVFAFLCLVFTALLIRGLFGHLLTSVLSQIVQVCFCRKRGLSKVIGLRPFPEEKQGFDSRAILSTFNIENNPHYHDALKGAKAERQERLHHLEDTFTGAVSQIASAKSFMGTIDADGDGTVSLEEAKGAGMSEDQFKTLDIDNDGQVTLEETMATKAAGLHTHTSQATNGGEGGGSVANKQISNATGGDGDDEEGANTGVSKDGGDEDGASVTVEEKGEAVLDSGARSTESKGEPKPLTGGGVLVDPSLQPALSPEDAPPESEATSQSSGVHREPFAADETSNDDVGGTKLRTQPIHINP